MSSLASPSRCHQPDAAQQAKALSRSALRAKDALVLKHLPLAAAIASVMARRLFPLVKREDLIQVGRESLGARCRAGEPGEPYLRCCITGALEHHLHDRVRLVRIHHRLLDQLASPEPELAASGAHRQRWRWSSWWISYPPPKATALQPTILDGLSMRAATEQLEIRAMSVERAQKKAIVALCLQLSGGD